MLAVATSGGAASLSVGSSAQWFLVSMPSLNQFVRLVNETVRFVNERVASDPVPLLRELTQGVGLRLTETFGGTLRVGLQMAMGNVTTRTQGAWASGGTSHEVSVALDAGLVAFMAEVALVLVPDILSVSISAGWGSSRLGHRCVFPATLPTDWSLPFLPKAEDKTYTASGPVGTASVQVTFPLGRGASAGFEIGYRLAPPAVPRVGTVVLDLNADGLGDPVSFTGLWLGLAVRMEFDL